jgi:small subunit ribosomal protein S16
LSFSKKYTAGLGKPSTGQKTEQQKALRKIGNRNTTHKVRAFLYKSSRCTIFVPSKTDRRVLSKVELKQKTMAVRIRLARRGRKKKPMYDVVVADSRAPRDGKFIEKVGRYNPLTDPATIILDEERILDWLLKGAQPTETVRRMLKYRGILLRKHLEVGVRKGAITREEADKRYQEWLKTKEAKIEGKKARLAQQKEAAKKAQLEAEAKIREERAKAIEAKRKAAEQETAASDESNENQAE